MARDRAIAEPWRRALQPGILIVSGKGGTGKSTVAAAVAMAASRAGMSVLLAELEGRGEITRSLGIPEPGYAIARTGLGFDAISITPLEAAFDYLSRYHGIDRLGRPLLRSGGLEQIVMGAPGFRDLLVAGKIYELARARAGDGEPVDPVHDLVVVDAPPTGQLVPFLTAPSTFADLVRVGPMKRRAANVAATLRSRARVVVVAIPEEMAVAETTEAVPAIRRTGLQVAAIVVNRVPPELLPPGASRAADALTPDALVASAAAAGLRLDLEEAGWLLRATRDALRDRRVARREVAELAGVAPVIEIDEMDSDLLGPALVDGIARAIAQGSAVDGPRASVVKAPDDLRAKKPANAAKAGLAARSLGDLLRQTRIVVVCGSGGVGKTTISAAIALHAATMGRTTALLTVDPARRLATALRLPRTTGDRTKIRVAKGRGMETMQLDTKRTFDELVERFARDAAQRRRILHNAFYRQLADTLGGTHEYMAMEKLHQLAEEEEHDAIVIDTPPTRSALSFLDAPRRLTDFLRGRFLRLLRWPTAAAGRFTLSAARLGARAVLRTVGRLVGAETLADTLELLAAFDGMYGGFADRAAKVMGLLASDQAAFVLVASPSETSLSEASAFVARLRQEGMRTAAVVVNRFDPDAPPARGVLGDGAEAAAMRLDAGGPEDRAVAAAVRLGRRTVVRSETYRKAVEEFAERHPDVPLVPVPDLGRDVHDVRGLRRVAERLFRDDMSNP